MRILSVADAVECLRAEAPEQAEAINHLHNEIHLLRLELSRVRRRLQHEVGKLADERVQQAENKAHYYRGCLDRAHVAIDKAAEALDRENWE